MGQDAMLRGTPGCCFERATRRASHNRWPQLIVCIMASASGRRHKAIKGLVVHGQMWVIGRVVQEQRMVAPALQQKLLLMEEARFVLRPVVIAAADCPF